ncbi:MAG: sulfurtransferase complex subunit TusB [Methylobacter sp.]|nr:sulfurtransferase complex subunit TusB [Methylobacter sp.]
MGCCHEVVLLENAVLHTLQSSAFSARLTQQLNSNRLYLLSTDMLIRGIAPGDLVKGLEVIDYAGLVDLTVNNPVIQSWT